MLSFLKLRRQDVINTVYTIIGIGIIIYAFTDEDFTLDTADFYI